MGKTLAEKNIYLQNANQRKRSMIRNVETSSAVEGIRLMRDRKTGQFIAKGEEVVLPVSQ